MIMCAKRLPGDTGLPTAVCDALSTGGRAVRVPELDLLMPRRAR